MKLIKFDDAKAKKAHSGHPCIQVDAKKQLLMEAEEINDCSYYVVTDSEEEKQLRDALAKTFPLLTEDDINKMLGIKAKNLNQ
ncbi:hypothetical protein [Saccharococcus sp. Marseille-Q5394]|uniref:hypothetical protein n=1 Tax=Saccharococcus sp. Marseille-Q5394 TaxID=2972778 RepID=UPI0021C988F2|nr:hypothetical protein [Saccharococcus sp. Marseille-Q5394]